MCGIVGYCRVDGLEPDAGANLCAMMDQLAHRGPDGRGQHLDPARGLALGHTRLQLVDLHGGAQPLWSADRQTVLIANNEFYDFKSIRAHLRCLGERFVSKSDAEIALALYRRHGLDFVDHLRGEFAFALYDFVEDRLILVRDRFGIKPLFVHQTDTAIYWASEIKALLAHPAIPRRLDAEAVLHQMMQVMVPGMTAFSAIEAVQPGRMLVVRRRGDRLERDERNYWDLDFPRAEDRRGHAGPDEWIDGVRERLIDAVRVRLEADVPVGCYLSGGIDSCSILGLATAIQQSPVKAFTIGFDDPAYDESTIAAQMAQETGAEHEILRLRPADLYGEHFSRVVWYAERTFYNTLAVAKWHMSRRVREHDYKAVITGEGSDELFAGYGFFRSDPAPEDRAEHPAWIELLGFTPAWLQPWIVTLERVRPLLAPALREQLAEYDPLAAIAAKLDRRQLDGRHPLDRMQYSWIKTMFEGQILAWGGDRVDMAHSLESRPAFLDHRLVEFARLIPPEYRIRGDTQKWVLREAMRGILPATLYQRPKFAFLAPPSGADPHQRAAVDALIERHASREAMLEAGLFDADRVAAFFSTSPSDSWSEAVRRDISINHILGLQILHQQLGR